MIGNIPLPTDRGSFDNAIATIFSEHATLRRMAEAASNESSFSADGVMSLVEAVGAHEGAEARLFDLPFLTRTPESVISSGARAHQLCLEYTSGKARHPGGSAAAALFADALLAHLTAEEAWLKQENELHHERLLKSI